MNKPKTIGGILELLKDQLQQNNQLDLEATEFQLVASPENTSLGDGNRILFMNGGDPGRMVDQTLAAVTETFRRRHNEEDTLKCLRKLFTSMAEAFLVIGQDGFDEHCGHDINRIAAEVFKKYSEHTRQDKRPTFQSEDVDDFDRLLQQTLDSLNLDDPATRNTLNDLYRNLGIVFDATRTKQ